MKVSRKVYYLILLIEECAEIIHRACKAIRFGMDERWKPETGTNRELLEGEIGDFQTILSLNYAIGNVTRTNPSKQECDRKTERVNKYMAYSFSHCQTITEIEGNNPPLVYSVWKAAQ